MPGFRFNHMELTVAKGVLEKHRDEIKEFYGDIFGFDALDVPILKQTGLLLRTDPETSQFILVTEQRQHLACPGYDHLGFLYESRDEVDALLVKCRMRRERDSRVELKEYDDLVVAGTTTHAFYVRFLLPIWFDVQVIEFSAETQPERSWRFASPSQP